LKTRMTVLTAVLLTVVMGGPAYPQNRDILQLQKDMIDVTQRVNQLQTTIDRDNALMKGLMEKIADQVNTLTGNIQKITQTVDSLKPQNDATTRELRTVTTTLKELEDALSSARAQINSISRELTTLKTTAEPLASPDDLWRTANSDYNVGNWNLAVQGLQEFLSKYPDDPRSPDAHLRIGDALTAQKKYELAFAEYDFVLQKVNDNDKMRAALLKKGLAQAETNQPQAIQTLNEVVKKFPNTSEASTAQLKLKELQSQRPRTPAR
jgi:tol-pal system protein YbgF